MTTDVPVVWLSAIYATGVVVTAIAVSQYIKRPMNKYRFGDPEKYCGSSSFDDADYVLITVVALAWPMLLSAVVLGYAVWILMKLVTLPIIGVVELADWVVVRMHRAAGKVIEEVDKLEGKESK